MLTRKLLGIPTLALLLALTAGCSDTIDATNKQTLDASAKAMAAKLSHEDQQKFVSGMTNIIEKAVGDLTIDEMMDPKIVADSQGRALKALDGKTAKEIMAASTQ